MVSREANLFKYTVIKYDKCHFGCLFLITFILLAHKHWADPLAQSLCLHRSSYVRLSYNSLCTSNLIKLLILSKHGYGTVRYGTVRHGSFVNTYLLDRTFSKIGL